MSTAEERRKRLKELKELYDDGLIDDEEYKRAKENIIINVSPLYAAEHSISQQKSRLVNDLNRKEVEKLSVYLNALSLSGETGCVVLARRYGISSDYIKELEQHPNPTEALISHIRIYRPTHERSLDYMFKMLLIHPPLNPPAEYLKEIMNETRYASNVPQAQKVVRPVRCVDDLNDKEVKELSRFLNAPGPMGSTFCVELARRLKMSTTQIRALKQSHNQTVALIQHIISDLPASEKSLDYMIEMLLIHPPLYGVAEYLDGIKYFTGYQASTMTVMHNLSPLSQEIIEGPKQEILKDLGPVLLLRKSDFNDDVEKGLERFRRWIDKECGHFVPYAKKSAYRESGEKQIREMWEDKDYWQLEVEVSSQGVVVQGTKSIGQKELSEFQNERERFTIRAQLGWLRNIIIKAMKGFEDPLDWLEHFHEMARKGKLDELAKEIEIMHNKKYSDFYKDAILPRISTRELAPIFKVPSSTGEISKYAESLSVYDISRIVDEIK